MLPRFVVRSSTTARLAHCPGTTLDLDRHLAPKIRPRISARETRGKRREKNDNEDVNAGRKAGRKRKQFSSEDAATGSLLLPFARGGRRPVGHTLSPTDLS